MVIVFLATFIVLEHLLDVDFFFFYETALLC